MDYVCFSSVCVSWRNAFNLHKPVYFLCSWSLPLSPPSPPHPPKTTKIYPNKKKIKMKKKKVHRVYSISNEKVDDRIKVKLPHHSQCRGSSNGWLVIVDDIETFPVRLFNPALLIVIFIILILAWKSSPRRPDHTSCIGGFTNEDLRKAVLSANPISNPTDYIVMAIYGGSKELAFVRPGDKVWTHIQSPAIVDSKLGHFDDVIYYQHKFFAIHCRGRVVVVCDDLAEGVTATVLLEPPEIEYRPSQKYLVESSAGNLLQVHRDVYIRSSNGRFIYSTPGFRVFKLLLVQNHQTKAQEIATLKQSDYKWVEVKNLCGDTIFLGQNASISISVPRYSGCKPNSIYYTDDSNIYINNPKDGPHDIGLFNLEDSTFENIFRQIFKTAPYGLFLFGSSQTYQRNSSSLPNYD